jgi:hypothetical protein
MSYSFSYPCSYCIKKDTCTDYSKVEKAIQEIHKDTYETGHQGSGMVVLQCTKADSKCK